MPLINAHTKIRKFHRDGITFPTKKEPVGTYQIIRYHHKYHQSKQKAAAEVKMHDMISYLRGRRVESGGILASFFFDGIFHAPKLPPRKISQ